jgi:acetyltransferase-like isoleucine patch superfamily enzyme
MSRGRDKFNKYKSLINMLVKVCMLLPNSSRHKLFLFFRMTNGNIGLLIRYILLKSIAKKCGDNVSIHPHVYIFNPQQLSIGDNVSIHPMCYIDASGGIYIGNDVSIAHAATIMSSTHQYSNLDIPIKDQPVDLLNTEIKDNVWVGAKVTILAGIQVGSGSVLAAGAVITKNVTPNVVVGGVPAIKIKDIK